MNKSRLLSILLSCVLLASLAITLNGSRMAAAQSGISPQQLHDNGDTQTVGKPDKHKDPAASLEGVGDVATLFSEGFETSRLATFRSVIDSCQRVLASPFVGRAAPLNNRQLVKGANL
jgi:hypothetical protein